MDCLLENKSAVVTGGTSGIGKAIAISFARQGANVTILGTNKERGEAVLQELKAVERNAGQSFHFFQVDIADFESVQKCFDQIFSNHPSIDILVNNAGITKDNLLMKMKEEDWDRVIDVNLKSVYNTCKMVIRPMMKARSGKIINISSVIGLTGNAGQVNYAASKSGMIGFTKSLAKELASRGVCVNCIAPGYIETPMTSQLPDSVQEEILSSIPLKRMGSPEDIANGAVFLASELSDYVTGQVLTIDGGMVI